jgi:hypothetical protein
VAAGLGVKRVLIREKVITPQFFAAHAVKLLVLTWCQIGTKFKLSRW